MNSVVGFIKALLRMAVISLLLSAILWGIQWFFGLTTLCSKPTGAKFLWGAIALFLFQFMLAALITAITFYRYHKDPIFKDANLKTGIGWKDYQRLKHTNNVD